MRPVRRPIDSLARATAAVTALGLALLLPLPASAQLLRPGTSIGPIAPTDAGAEVVLRALSLLGVNYRFGGNTPESGLDCSGLVRFVFTETLGMPLPRRSEEISRVGAVISPRELQPGDLVFFNTLRRAFSHVGIYIGNNQFVHAPATGKSIRVESLSSSYWVRRFNGARRLLDGDGPVADGRVQPDALVAAGLVPAPPGSPPVRTHTALSSPRAKALPGPSPTRSSGRPAAAILPPVDLGSLTVHLTMN